MATVELSVDANLQGLRQQLQSIPGLTAEQARLMTAELNKSFKASEKAAKAAADASRRAMETASSAASEAAANVSKVGDRFGAVGSSSAKLAGALSMLSPALGEGARGIADLADVGEVGALAFESMGAAIIPLTATVALFAATFAPIAQLFEENAARAEAAKVALEAFTAAQEAAGSAAASLSDMLSSVQDEIKIKTGLETADEQATRKKTEALYASVDALEASYAAENDQARATLEATRVEYGLLEAKILTGKATEEEADSYRKLGEKVNEATKALKDNAGSVSRARALAEAQAQTLADIAAAEKLAKEKAEAATKARERAAKASALKAAREREDADAIKAITDEIAAYEKIDADWQRSLEQGRVAEEAQAKAINDQAVKALDNYRARITELVPEKPLSDLEKMQAIIADLDLAMSQAPTEELGMRYKAMSDQAIAALEGLEAKQREAFTTERLEAFAGQLDKITQIFGVLTDASSYFSEQSTADYQAAIDARDSLGKKATRAEKEAAAERVKATREAAIKSFLIDKAVKVAQAIAATALAATQALAIPPAPNFFAAGLAAAAGAVQVAKISSENPSFHKGGLIGQPDEQSAIVRSGEAVLNPMGRSQLGDATIKAANAGMLGGAGGTAVQVVYKHKSFDYFVRDHLQTNATLPRALGAGRRLGHRGG